MPSFFSRNGSLTPDDDVRNLDPEGSSENCNRGNNSSGVYTSTSAAGTGSDRETSSDDTSGSSGGEDNGCIKKSRCRLKMKKFTGSGETVWPITVHQIRTNHEALI